MDSSSNVFSAEAWSRELDLRAVEQPVLDNGTDLSFKDTTFADLDVLSQFDPFAPPRSPISNEDDETLYPYAKTAEMSSPCFPKSLGPGFYFEPH